MNPDLWKLKRDNWALEHMPHNEHPITNEYPAVMQIRLADAMPNWEQPGAIKPRQAAS